MKVLKLEPLTAPYIKEIDSGLEALQKEVGGTIQVVYPFPDEVGIICNDEGKINGLPINRPLRDENGEIYDIICGDFLVVGLDNENDTFKSLSKSQLKKFEKIFRTCIIDNKIIYPIIIRPNQLKTGLKENKKER